MRSRPVLLAVLAIALIAVCAAGGPAAARPRTSLRLRITGALESTRSASLRCDPTGGTHPHRAAACRALAAAHGRFSKLKGHPHVLCPDLYAPVTATATGTYRGRRVRFRHTYSNACDLDRATAPVFAL